MDEIELPGLVKRLKDSDHISFELLFNRFHQSIFNFLLIKTRDEAVAEDLLQEVFIKLWNNRLSLDEGKSVKNYLYTIADNLALNHIRHLKVVSRHEQLNDVRIFDSSQVPHFILEEKEIQEHLMQAIEDLPEKPRLIFVMSRFEDLSYAEIAERLSLSIKSVEGYMSKALKILREKLSVKI
jgi:RNA polymerase sigma-70 factor (family 1)